MFKFNKKDELYYLQEILNMYSWSKMQYVPKEKYLKNIKHAILSINTDKINSPFIKNIQIQIFPLKLNNSKDFLTMENILDKWSKYKEDLNK